MASRRIVVLLAVVGVILAGCTASTDPARSTTTKPSTSTAAPTTVPEGDPPSGWRSAEVEIGAEAEPIGVWSTANGFVMVAVAEEDLARRIVLWRSPDGIEWTPVPSRGPVVDGPVVAVGSAGMAVSVPGDNGWDALAVSQEGVTWQTIQPPVDWIADTWRLRDGFEYVHAGFEVDGIEVGQQGVAVVLTRDAYVDFETAIRDAMPELTAPYVVLRAHWIPEDDTVDVSGIREYADWDHSLCDPYWTEYEVATESLGTMKLEDIGIDPELVQETHQWWQPMVWHSSDWVSWSLEEPLTNEGPLWMPPSLLTDIDTGYVANLAGDLAYSPDVVHWTFPSSKSGERYHNVDNLTWTGDELVVGMTVSDPNASSADTYEVWAGSVDDLHPVAGTPEDPLLPAAYMRDYAQLAVEPGGTTAVVGSDSDAYPAGSRIWILHNDGAIEHDLGYLSHVAPRLAAGDQRFVVINTATSEKNDVSAQCETTVTIDTYAAG